MEILREYYLQNNRTPIHRCSSTSSPNTGDHVVIKSSNYEIIRCNYDYEVWQSTGIFVYSCVVRELVESISITQKIFKYFSVESPIEFNAIDFINGSYPGGDIGDYMHDGSYRYLAVTKYKVNDRSEAELIEKELSKNSIERCDFDILFTRLNNSKFLLERNQFKAKLYWPGIHVPSFIDIFNRDGSTEIFIQIIVERNISIDFEKFIQECMASEM